MYTLLDVLLRLISTFSYVVIFVLAFTVLPKLVQAVDTSPFANTRRHIRMWLRIIFKAKSPSPDDTPRDLNSVTAHAIKGHLDTRVVGQEAAKLQLSVLLSMHLAWFRHQSRLHR